MTINVCLATRGNPRQLRETLQQTLNNSSLETTRFVVGFDNDDPLAKTAKLPESPKIVTCFADREDSLGEKYNRCAKHLEADLYVLLTDDEAIATPKWDERLEEAAKLFEDGLGVVYFGQPPVPSTMPAGFAVTHKFMEKMGFFMSPLTPFWWHDTTLDEIANFTGRVINADVQMAYPYGYGRTRGLRDVSYWATFHDLMRAWRWKIAEKIIDDPENADQPWRKLQLKQNAGTLAQHFSQRNAMLRDPLKAREFEQNQSYDAPANERYARIKAASQVLLTKEMGVTVQETKATEEKAA